MAKLYLIISVLLILVGCNRQELNFPKLPASSWVGIVEVPGLIPQTTILIEALHNSHSLLLLEFAEHKTPNIFPLKKLETNTSSSYAPLSLSPKYPCEASGEVSGTTLTLRLNCKEDFSKEFEFKRLPFSLQDYENSSVRQVPGEKELIEVLTDIEITSHRLNTYAQELHQANKNLASLKRLARNPGEMLQAINKVNRQFSEKLEEISKEDIASTVTQKRRGLSQTSDHALSVSINSRINRIEWESILQNEIPTKVVDERRPHQLNTPIKANSLNEKAIEPGEPQSLRDEEATMPEQEDLSQEEKTPEKDPSNNTNNWWNKL